MEPNNAQTMPLKSWKSVLGWIWTFIVLLLKIGLFIVFIGFISSVIAAIIEGGDSGEGPPPKSLWIVLKPVIWGGVLFMCLRFLQKPKGRALNLRLQWPLTQREKVLFSLFATLLVVLAFGAGNMSLLMSDWGLWSFLDQSLGAPIEDSFRLFIFPPAVWQFGYSLIVGGLMVIAEGILFHAILQQGIEQRSSKTIGALLTILFYSVTTMSVFSPLFIIPSTILYAQRNNLGVAIAFSVFTIILVVVLMTFVSPV